MDLRSRWPQRLGGELLDQLLACYREKHRHYHTLQHLEECFEKFERYEARARANLARSIKR